MKTTKLLSTVLMVLASGVSARPLSASNLWGIYVGNNTSILLNELDPATGAIYSTLPIGEGLAFTNVDDLASDPLRQPRVVWAIRNSINGNELIAVDPFDKKLLSLTVLDAPTPIDSLAIDPTDGALYGASASALYRISTETGQTTLVGPTSMSVAKALGFDATGTLYGIANNNVLVSVNKQSAATTVVATLALGRMEDMAVRPEDGVMYGLGYAYNLYQIDLATGALKTVGPSVIRPSGLAFTSASALAGDFNGDNSVDAADYVVWRKSDGSLEDYDVWRAHFGQTGGSPSAQRAAGAVPEPASTALIILGCTGLVARRRKRCLP
jgi:hypothetical protein